jgi:anthranilate synthase component 2
MHGKSSVITLDTASILFAGMPGTIQGGRYHSLAADSATVPEVLQITARTEDGEVMGIQHRDYAVYGVQFHPESILTPEGTKIVTNFLGVSSND